MNDGQEILKETPSDFQTNRDAKIFYQMEFPKKTGRHAKKYMGIFCMILVCAIISAAIASIFSTKSLRENIPSDVEQLISKGELKTHIDGLRNEVHNITDETKINNKYHFDSLSAKEDMETLSNKINTELLLQTLPNIADLGKVSNETRMDVELLLQALPRGTVRQDIEELSKKIDKNLKWILKVLPNKADFDVWTGKDKRILQRIYHAIRCSIMPPVQDKRTPVANKRHREEIESAAKGKGRNKRPRPDARTQRLENNGGNGRRAPRINIGCNRAQCSRNRPCTESLKQQLGDDIPVLRNFADSDQMQT
ncbi:uncharacterized protein LOC134228739, partial [Saccostrea cucullata]|uniref:uncharacterized protein LOC134228739 n=1 Tax=Saccostrea cuccullata TaxID=36930 RepID=UPI002ED50ECC